MHDEILRRIDQAVHVPALAELSFEEVVARSRFAGYLLDALDGEDGGRQVLLQSQEQGSGVAEIEWAPIRFDEQLEVYSSRT